MSEGLYGTYALLQSSEAQKQKDIKFTSIADLNESLDGQDVWVRGRLHTSRVKGKTCFIVVRHQIYTVQGTLFVGPQASKQMVKFIGGVSKVSWALFATEPPFRSPSSTCAARSARWRSRSLPARSRPSS